MSAADSDPWTIYMLAREEARRRGDRRVGTEHLVLGLLREPTVASALDRDLDGAREALAAMDREALAALGLGADLDVPPLPSSEIAATPSRPGLRAVLKDRLPLTPAAKTALRDASKGTRRAHRVAPRQVLLRLLDLEPPDPAAELLAALDVDRAAARGRAIDA